MFCKQCGGPIKAEAQFCPHCGIAAGVVTGPAKAPVRRAGAIADGKDGRRVDTKQFSIRIAGFLLVLAVGTAATYQFLGARQRPAPGTGSADSCLSEPDVRSTNGAVDAMLSVTNQSATPVVVHWINFSGTRERHFEVASQGSRNQRSPRTYPWVVTTPSGDCLQLVATPGPVVIK